MVGGNWTLVALAIIQVMLGGVLITADNLGCSRKDYEFRVTQTDDQGKQCWDAVIVPACFGRCDSNEISDWRFPYKRSYHPVCVHAGRSKAVWKLRHCEAGVAPGTDTYVYTMAESCRCQACTSSDTSCEGVRYSGHRAHAMTFMALGSDDGSFGDDDNMID
uniref:Glycoprotein hormone beta 5 n=1 Tax=Carabus violaceus TaxID=41075 RepID=A0A7U3MCA2_CARVO|nr:glycoprotein hormone beta 5 [Carabus violaceus]